MIFDLNHTQIQCVKLTTREGVFIFDSSGQEDVYIGIGSIYKV